jgi:hypothetical protein
VRRLPQEFNMINNTRLQQITARQLAGRRGIRLFCVALLAGVALQIWSLSLAGAAANFAG